MQGALSICIGTLLLPLLPTTRSWSLRMPLPLGVIVHPMADEARGRSVPVVQLSNAGIVRCRRCRTYMNPFIQWTDSGRRFKCNVCAMLNELPGEYFSSLDHNGRRRDADERPELSQGTVEYVAPADYMVGARGGTGFWWSENESMIDTRDIIQSRFGRCARWRSGWNARGNEHTRHQTRRSGKSAETS